MSEQPYKQISKRLSYILRHRPDSVGLSLGEGGWIAVGELLERFIHKGKPLRIDLLERVVAENDKQRFEFSPDRTKIRARQGHSAAVELGYEPADPPDELFHGTAERNLDSIFAEGLLKGNRHHVHMSTNKETMLAVGRRHGKPVLLSIDAKQMADDGHTFFVTGNDVWLTEHVPTKYLRVAES